MKNCAYRPRADIYLEGRKLRTSNEPETFRERWHPHYYMHYVIYYNIAALFQDTVACYTLPVGPSVPWALNLVR